MLIAKGYPKKAKAKPNKNRMNGITSAFFTSSTFDKCFKIKQGFCHLKQIMLTMMKSKPYNTSSSKENGLFATNVVNRELVKQSTAKIYSARLSLH